MSELALTVEQMNGRLRKSPFNNWLGLEVTAADADVIVFRVPWRPEFTGSPDTGFAHGGILASIIDAVASFAISSRLGRFSSTIDMRVDYHYGMAPGELRAEGRVVKLGRTISVADARLFDEKGVLVSSGRAVYMTAA